MVVILMFVKQKNNNQNDIENKKWGEKQLYGYFKQETKEIAHENIPIWLRKGHLKREIEAVLIIVQNSTIRISYETKKN